MSAVHSGLTMRATIPNRSTPLGASLSTEQQLDRLLRAAQVRNAAPNVANLNRPWRARFTVRLLGLTTLAAISLAPRFWGQL